MSNIKIWDNVNYDEFLFQILMLIKPTLLESFKTFFLVNSLNTLQRNT